MPVAAVPSYLQKNDPQFYLSAPPGHRFLLYFPAWGDNREADRIDWSMNDRVPKVDKRTKQQKTGKFGPEWDDLPNDQYACTIAACKTPTFDEERPRRNKPHQDQGINPWRPMLDGVLRRQATMAAAAHPDALLSLEALATAPFTTGLGNEHPLENGFAFLNPYGLPYLPGSGVKGVLRQAARELASGDWGDAQGWSLEPRYPLRVKGKPVLDSHKQPVVLSMLDVLFGRETSEGDSDHVRGALSFWDLIPQIAGDSLQVEIMTPHQSHYYQERAHAGSITPHESGQPKPISFLTVPPGSGFTFHIICDRPFLARLAPDLADGGAWKTLLEAAFTHAFDWLGFGAKTAVGYGALRRDLEREADELRQQEARLREAEAAAQAQRQAEEK